MASIQQLSGAQPPPASNPFAKASGNSSNVGNGGAGLATPTTPTAKVAFERVQGLQLRLGASTAAAATSAVAAAEPSSPSAPPLEQLEHRGPSRANIHPAAAAALLSAAARGPVDFYASLRASLLPTASKAATPGEQQQAAGASTKPHEDAASDDEWDISPAKPSAAAAAAASASAAATGAGDKAAEDEAVVHNKHATVIVRKMPLPKPDLGDSSGSSATKAAPAAAATKKAAADDDLFDDDFADIPSAATVGAAAAASATATAAAAGGPEEDGEEVAVFDLSNADWWFVVPHPDRPTEELKAAPPASVDPQEDEDGFVVVRNKDSFAALSDFLAQMMLQHPEINQLSPEQLRAMIEGSMSHLKEPSTVGKLWQYGKSAYTVWGWSSTAWSLYKDQTMLRIAAAGIIKCAQCTPT